MNKKVSIGILSGDVNSDNMGCNALTYGAIKILSSVAVKLNINCTFYLFTFTEDCNIPDYINDLDVSCEIINPYLSIKNKLYTILKGNYHKIVKFDHIYNGCDIFFEISGGDSFSDIYGINRLKLNNKFHKRIIKDKKKLVLLPQTIGPFYSKKAVEIAETVLNYAERTFVRDPISFEIAAKYTTTAKIINSNDLAFFMKVENKKRKIINKKTVGINPSGLLWNGGYTNGNQFELKIDYRELIDVIINDLYKKEYDIILIPHVLHGPAFYIEDDYRVCKEIKRKYQYCEIAPFFYSPIEAKEFIGELDLLIGSRMHCCIAAYSTSIPILALSYSRKFSGLFNKKLDYKYVSDLKVVELFSVLDMLDELLLNLEKIKKEIQQSNREINNELDEFSLQIMEILKEL